MGTGPLFEFALVFVVIASTELIDRTNFALIGLASRNPPLSVWAGAAAGFALTTALSVAIGTSVLAALGGHVLYLRLGGGAFLLAYAGYLAIVPESERKPPSGRSVWATAFLAIFLLELGDTTMVFTIVFVGTLADPVVVGLAAGLALASVAATACVIGSRLGARVEPKRLERLVIVILAAVGVLTIVYALFPSAFALPFG
ncbi:MAG: TMEM165/GDT1 family protein [Thermoplasmata archaeon]|nr:TMEM165/GDT1 family protein [Thermoplasmata archaeon]